MADFHTTPLDRMSVMQVLALSIPLDGLVLDKVEKLVASHLALTGSSWFASLHSEQLGANYYSSLPIQRSMVGLVGCENPQSTRAYQA